MSFGKMNTPIYLTGKKVTIDEEGFKQERNQIVVSVRAYREGRHGSERWANRAVFSDATELFRFRTIPDVTVTTDMKIHCDGKKYEIISVENVKGRGMYIEVLAKEVKESG